MKVTSKATAILLAVMMVFAMTPLLPMSGQTAYATEGDPSITIGSDVLSQNVNEDRATTQVVHYGSRDWLVIQYGGEGNPELAKFGVITLLHRDLAERTEFNPRSLVIAQNNQYANAYVGSTLQSVIEGYLTGDNPVISVPEQSSMVERFLEGGGENSDPRSMKGESLTAKIWPLSIAEARELPDSILLFNLSWWLRTPGRENVYAGAVSNVTVDFSNEADMQNTYVRPAFDLDSSDVLFTSAVEGGKNSGAQGANALQQVGTNSGNEWKVTLFDAERSTFGIDQKNVVYNKDTGVIKVPYFGAASGDNEYISAIIVNSSGEITYYGRVAKASASNATVTINMKGKFQDGDRLFVYNEQFNGDKTADSEARTDFANNPEGVFPRAVNQGKLIIDLSAGSKSYSGETCDAIIKTLEWMDENDVAVYMGRTGTRLYYDLNHDAESDIVIEKVDGETPTITIEKLDTGTVEYATTNAFSNETLKELTAVMEELSFYGSLQFVFNKKSIDNAKVVLSKTSYTYNGKEQKPTIKTIGGKTLIKDTDYTMVIKNSKGTTVKSPKAAGTYTVIATGKVEYAGTAKATFKINKAANTFKPSGLTTTVKYSKVKKASQKLKRSKVIKFVKSGQGNKTYIKSKGNKKITISKTTGKVTVKKGLTKGNYQVTVKVKAAGNSNYKASTTKKVTFTIKVK